MVVSNNWKGTENIPNNFVSNYGSNASDFVKSNTCSDFYKLEGTSEHPSVKYQGRGGLAMPMAGAHVYGLAIDKSGYIFSSYVGYINTTASGSIGGYAPRGYNRQGYDYANYSHSRAIFTRDIYQFEQTTASSVSLTEMRLTIPGNELTVDNVTTTEPDKDVIKFSSSHSDTIDTSLSGDINFGPESKTSLDVEASNEEHSIPWIMKENTYITGGSYANNWTTFDGNMEVGEWKQMYGYTLQLSTGQGGQNVNMSASTWDEDKLDLWLISYQGVLSHIDKHGGRHYCRNHAYGSGITGMALRIQIWSS